MPGSETTATGGPCLWCPLRVDHVPEMVLGFLLVRVLLGEELLVWQLEDDAEEVKKRENDVAM